MANYELDALEYRHRGEERANMKTTASDWRSTLSSLKYTGLGQKFSKRIVLYCLTTCMRMKPNSAVGTYKEAGKLVRKGVDGGRGGIIEKPGLPRLHLMVGQQALPPAWQSLKVNKHAGYLTACHDNKQQNET